MSKRNQDDLTFDRLQDYLCRRGFDLPARLDKSLAFHHPDSGTIIVLSIPEDGCSVRAADVLSVSTRLESAGLADENEIRRLKLGKLPVAA